MLPEVKNATTVEQIVSYSFPCQMLHGADARHRIYQYAFCLVSNTGPVHYFPRLSRCCPYSAGTVEAPAGLIGHRSRHVWTGST